MNRAMSALDEIPYTDENHGKDELMQTSTDKPNVGFDVMWRMRVPADLVPRMHAHARSRGLNSSAWIRMLILDALDESGAPADHREAA